MSAFYLFIEYQDFIVLNLHYKNALTAQNEQKDSFFVFIIWYGGAVLFKFIHKVQERWLGFCPLFLMNMAPPPKKKPQYVIY